MWHRIKLKEFSLIKVVWMFKERLRENKFKEVLYLEKGVKELRG